MQSRVHPSRYLHALVLLCASAIPATGLSGTTPSEQPTSSPYWVEKPVWEAGVGAALISVEAYPSSSRSTKRSLGLPFFVYRGERVRLQGGGLTAVAIENQRVTLDISLGASFSVDSEDTPLRDGLPDLDFLFELGPKVEVRLFDRLSDTGSRQRMSWNTALRASFSTNFSSVQSRGYVLSTQLQYKRDGFISPNTSVFATIGPTWATEKLGDYIYQVQPQFATNERAAFNGRGGYIATNAAIGIRHKFTPALQVFFAIGTGFHQGAANRNSPLFEENFTSGFGLGIAWSLKRSAESVMVIDD